MPRKVKSNESEAEPTGALSVTQEQALARLLLGQSQTDTAAEIGVPVEVLDGWLTRDAAFIAARNRQRRDEWEAQEQRLRTLAGKAVDTLAGLLDSDDEATRLKAAGTALKFVSLHGSAPSGPTEPEAVVRGWEEAAAYQEREDHLRQLLNSF